MPSPSAQAVYRGAEGNSFSAGSPAAVATTSAKPSNIIWRAAVVSESALDLAGESASGRGSSPPSRRPVSISSVLSTPIPTTGGCGSSPSAPIYSAVYIALQCARTAGAARVPRRSCPCTFFIAPFRRRLAAFKAGSTAPDSDFEACVHHDQSDGHLCGRWCRPASDTNLGPVSWLR